MAILHDGFNTTITFAGSGVGVTFIEREVTPPTMEGGGAINMTAMRNAFWRTMSPKYLVTLGHMALKVEYDAIVYALGQIRSIMNVVSPITLNFPGLLNLAVPDPVRTISFRGWLDKFAPEAMKEGELPLADIEIIPSLINQNGTEASPTTT